MFVIVLMTLFAAQGLNAQEVALPDVSVTEDMMTKPFDEWQLNLTTVLVAVMFLGRMFKYMRSNGGLKSIVGSIWNGAVKGENTPDR